MLPLSAPGYSSANLRQTPEITLASHPQSTIQTSIINALLSVAQLSCSNESVRNLRRKGNIHAHAEHWSQFVSSQGFPCIINYCACWVLSTTRNMPQSRAIINTHVGWLDQGGSEADSPVTRRRLHQLQIAECRWRWRLCSMDFVFYANIAMSCDVCIFCHHLVIYTKKLIDGQHETSTMFAYIYGINTF